MLKKLTDYQKNAIISTAIILVGVFLDQLSKWLVVKFLKPIGDLPLIQGVFHFTYSENPGAAFGMLKDDRWVFMTFSTVMILAMLIFLFYPKNGASRLFSAAMATVVAGGIGNMIDRIALEYVVDFLNFKLINFAIFNVADSFVCVGAGLMMLSVILEILEESKKKKEKQENKESV